MKKHNIALIIIIILSIIYFYPVSASEVISSSFKDNEIIVRDFLIMSPGLGKGMTSYNLTANGTVILFKEMNDMKLVKFPIGKYISGVTTEKTYKINLVENNNKVIYFSTFKNKVLIDGKYYLIINRGELLFDNLTDELIKIEEY